MSAGPVPMTKRGHKLLVEELKKLKEIERPKVIEAIATAREYGDLSENAEYHVAKERQGFLEGRIQELSYKLGCAEIVDTSIVSVSVVSFGATVELEGHDEEETVTYQIVGEDEADIRQGYLSITSPLARSLLGKEREDEVSIQTPKGTRTFTLIDIKAV